MNSRLLVAVVCLLSLAGAQGPWGGESQGSRAGAYALEGLGALGGGVGCGCLGVVGAGLALVVSGYDMDQPSNTAAMGAYTGVLLVSAAALPAAMGFGAAKAGEGLGEYGSTGWAIGGAYAGTVVGAALVAIGAGLAGLSSYQSSWISIPFYVLGGLAVPTGAVVGYNSGPATEGRGDQLRFGGRLQPPAVALTGVELPDRSVEYGVKVQLAGLRF